MRLTASYRAFMGIPRKKRKPQPPWFPERDAEIVTLYQDGQTLQQIGTRFGVTRERVRQVLKRNGLVRKDGGVTINSDLRKLNLEAKQNALWIDKYGCDYEAIKQYRQQYPKATAQFRHQRQSSKRRKIEWQLSFAEWIKIWIESGHYHERGLGKGKYSMCRIGDSGPYAVGNVRIDLSTENSREGIKLSYQKGRIKRSFTHCRRGHELTPDNIYSFRGDRQCRKCIAIRSKIYYERKKAKLLASR